jgi:hypothetical protein
MMPFTSLIKKKAIFSLLFFIISVKLFGQIADIHDIIFSVGIGDPLFPKAIYPGETLKVPAFIKGEYNLKRNASLGISYGHYSNIDDTTVISTNRFHVRFLKYLVKQERFALYISPGLGYNLNQSKGEHSKKMIDPDRIPVSFSFQLGTRFLVTKHTGLYLEYFYDISMFQIGVFYKIYRK